MSTDKNRVQIVFVCKTSDPDKTQKFQETFEQTMEMAQSKQINSHMTHYDDGLLCFVEGDKELLLGHMEELVEAYEVSGLDVLCEVPTAIRNHTIDEYKNIDFENVIVRFLRSPAGLKRYFQGIAPNKKA